MSVANRQRFNAGQAQSGGNNRSTTFWPALWGRLLCPGRSNRKPAGILRASGIGQETESR